MNKLFIYAINGLLHLLHLSVALYRNGAYKRFKPFTNFFDKILKIS